MHQLFIVFFDHTFSIGFLLEGIMSEGKYESFMMRTKTSMRQSAQLTINQRFRMSGLKQQHGDYNIYQGIDIERSKWVHVYLKLKSNNYPFSKNVRENLRNQLCPKVIETGEIDISKFKYAYEVHERYGPSLHCLFNTIKKHITGKQLLHLLFEMLKLIQKMDSVKLVCGQLTPQSIVFDINPRRNELFLLNSFDLKKRNQESKPIHSRYCSRGAHLGRTISIKDDLQSICYILIDIFTQGNFLMEKEAHEFKEYKLSLKVEQFAEGLPQTFIDFYYYVINLNYSDDINYFYWKSHLTKLLTLDAITHPYHFLMAKANIEQQNSYQKSDDEEEESEINDIIETFEEEIYHQKENRFTKVERIMKDNAKFKNSLL